MIASALMVAIALAAAAVAAAPRGERLRRAVAIIRLIFEILGALIEIVSMIRRARRTAKDDDGKPEDAKPEDAKGKAEEKKAAAASKAAIVPCPKCSRLNRVRTDGGVARCGVCGARIWP